MRKGLESMVVMYRISRSERKNKNKNSAEIKEITIFYKIYKN